MTPSSDDEGIVLRSVLCGVDSSRASEVAVRAGARLAEDGARMAAVSAWDPRPAGRTGIYASRARHELHADALDALRRARELEPAIEPLLMEGGEVASVLRAAGDVEADLLSVGATGTSRLAGVVFGSVATAAVHHAPCSVLVARGEAGEGFPRRILHCGDGSEEADEAARLAGRLAARLGAAAVTVTVGEEADEARSVAEGSAAAIGEAGADAQVRVAGGSPPSAIGALAADLDADLVILGSRGLIGVRALGSVSERVAHHAPCSVLVARLPSHPVAESAAAAGQGPEAT